MHHAERLRHLASRWSDDTITCCKNCNSLLLKHLFLVNANVDLLTNHTSVLPKLCIGILCERKHSAVVLQLTVECPNTLQWAATFPPQKLPLLLGGSGPYLIHGSLGPLESSTQMASRSVRPLLQGSQTLPTDRPLSLANAAMRPNTNSKSTPTNVCLVKMLVNWCTYNGKDRDKVDNAAWNQRVDHDTRSRRRNSCPHYCGCVHVAPS